MRLFFIAGYFIQQAMGLEIKPQNKWRLSLAIKKYDEFGDLNALGVRCILFLAGIFLGPFNVTKLSHGGNH